MNITYAQSPAPAGPQAARSSRPITRLGGKAPAAIMLAALLTGCTLGPDFQQPDTHAPQQWDQLEGEHAPSQPVAEPMQLRWWDSFHDPRLSALIEQVAARNLDLQIASARLLQSRALRSTVAADQQPSVDANAGYSRARNSAEGLSDPSGNAGKSAFNLWQGDW